MLVRFGNNWIQKIPLTAKLDSAYGLVQFWLSSEFFSSIYFQIGRHVVRLHILIICILRNTHQKASSHNFLSQMRSSQSEDQTLFFTCAKKNDTTNQKPQRYVSSVSKFPPFIGTWSLQGLYSCFADIQWEKFLPKSFSCKKSEKHLGNWSGIVSFVSLSMKKIIERLQNHSRRRKTEQDVR